MGLPAPGELGLLALAARIWTKYNIPMRILLVVLFLLGVFSPLQAARPVRGVPTVPLLRRAEAVILRKLASLRRTPAVKNSLFARQVRFLTPARPLPVMGKSAGYKEVLSSLALPLDAEGFVVGSGFVIRSGSGRLYAVTSYHVTGSAGKPAGVRLFLPDGRAVDYTGLSVAAGGSFGINAPDVSLIELPSAVDRLVRPLGVAAHPPRKGSKLFMWGRPYDAAGIERAGGLAVESSFGMKIVLNRTEEVKYLEGMCGAPVLDEDGLVTGIYGGRGGKNGALFAVDARKSLSWLLQNYESGVFTPYTFKVFGQPALELAEGESVTSISHRTGDGLTLKTIDFPTFRDPLDAQILENSFEDLRPGDVISFDVWRGHVFSRFVFFKIP